MPVKKKEGGHETILGVRNGKLVVGCKDFCAAEGALWELGTLKNVCLSNKLSEGQMEKGNDTIQA